MQTLCNSESEKPPNPWFDDRSFAWISARTVGSLCVLLVMIPLWSQNDDGVVEISMVKQSSSIDRTTIERKPTIILLSINLFLRGSAYVLCCALLVAVTDDYQTCTLGAHFFLFVFFGFRETRESETEQSHMEKTDREKKKKPTSKPTNKTTSKPRRKQNNKST